MKNMLHSHHSGSRTSAPSYQLNISMDIKYFLYARKSTEERSRQLRSIPAQIREGCALALQKALSIADKFEESQTAKEPGRPDFNDMVRRLKNGEAQGIIAWHPNRLARNAVDGGVIIDLINRGILKDLQFVSYHFDNTPEGKMMLYITFAQSAYEVDKLAVDTKRGLEEKVMRGEYPGRAPTGYRNNKATKLMVPDPKRFKYIQELFQRYSTGSHSLRSLSEIMAERGLRSRNRNILGISSIEHILKNPFYYGDFLYNRELHHGVHKPAISKSLFDRCQTVMKRRAHPMKPAERLFAFRGLLSCRECRGAITSEIQKGHIYYRCTKKKGPCLEPYVREEALDAEISRVIGLVSLSPEWAKRFLKELHNSTEALKRSTSKERSELKQALNAIDEKLDALLDARLAKELTVEEFVPKKNKLRQKHADLVEKLERITDDQLVRLEPVRNLISTCCRATEIQMSDRLLEKRDFLKNLGSNLFLHNREVNWCLDERWKRIVDSGFFGPRAHRAPGDEHAYAAMRPVVLRILEEIRKSFS
jgi:site-specific DNA recombinase